MGTEITSVKIGSEVDRKTPTQRENETCRDVPEIFRHQAENDVDVVRAENGDVYVKREISVKEKLFHYDLAWLAQDAYRGDGDKRGYTELSEYNRDYFWGFKARVYKNEKDNTIVIAYSGTDGFSPVDMWNNFIIKCGGLPPQYDHAMDLYLELANNPEIKKNGTKIIVIGHSLGGNLAQFVASTTKYKGEEVTPPYLAVSFNAPPSKDIIDDEDDEDHVLQDIGNIISCFYPGDKLTTETIEDALEGQPGVIMQFGSALPKQDDIFKDKVRDIVAGVSLSVGEGASFIDSFPGDSDSSLTDREDGGKFKSENQNELVQSIQNLALEALTISAAIKLGNIPAGSSLFPEHSIIRFMEKPVGFINGKYYVPFSKNEE